MNKPILAILSLFLFGFFIFLSLAPLNQSFAVKEGERCRYGTRITSTDCDTGLDCDVSADTSAECDVGKVCNGVCRKPPKTCSALPGGPVNGGCKVDEEVCTANYGQTGVCIPDASPHVLAGGFCKISDPNKPQGNCIANHTCSLSPGLTAALGSTGICLPVTYSCYTPRTTDTKPPGYIKCPGATTCGQLLFDKCMRANAQYDKDCATCFVSSDITVSCKCTNKEGESVGAGKNGFHCKSNTLGEVDSFCDPATKGCYNDSTTSYSRPDVWRGQTLNGIRCIEPEKKNPPAPPCNKFVNGECTEILTAFGNVGTDPVVFITRFFGILLGAAGAIALLLIMRAGYQIMTARGNPEGIKEGREKIVAAIVGLLFLIFSFVLLQVIGVDLLKLPISGGNSLGLGATCEVSNSRCQTGLVCNYVGAQGQCQKQ